MVQKNKVKCIFDTSKENGCCIKINLASELNVTALKTFVLSQLHRLGLRRIFIFSSNIKTT